MKKFIQRLSFIAFVLIVGGVAANAQVSRKFNANIPFDFAIGGKTLPAGKYVIRLAGDANGPGYIQVQNEKRELVYSGIAATNAERLTDSAELRFAKGSARPELQMIVSDRSGHSLPTPQRAKLIAASKKDRDTSVKN